MALTGEATGHGAVQWFADQVPCGINTASRFVNEATGRPSPKCTERLHELEREMADDPYTRFVLLGGDKSRWSGQWMAQQVNIDADQALDSTEREGPYEAAVSVVPNRVAAAAPRLLEVAELLIDSCDSRHATGGCPWCGQAEGHGEYCALDKARRAVAEAKG